MLNHVKLWIYVEMLIGQDSDVAFERNMNSKKIFCEDIEYTEQQIELKDKQSLNKVVNYLKYQFQICEGDHLSKVLAI
jgi:hypothetical protein